MKKIKFIVIFVIVISLFFSFLTCFADSPTGDSFSVEAGAAILVDMDTGSVLYEQDADATMYPASLTKLMTCLIAVEMGALDDQVTASETAFEGLIDAGSTANILPGETMTLRDLLYCALLPSANEACNIIAEYISGSVDAFVVLMNEKALAMGCTGTHFANATGLHDDNHYTTARDMSLIASTAFSNDALRQIASTPEHTIAATNMSEERIVSSTDQLISDSVNDNYLYQYAVCGKTGYTTPAGRCLISCATKDGTTLVSVIMKTDSVTMEDGSTRVMSFYETIRLFEYGFSAWSTQTILSQGTPLAEVNVKLGSDADSVVLCAGNDMTYLLKNSFDQSQITRVITVYNEDNITAPVAKGEELGNIELFMADGTSLGSSPLVAQTDIARSVPETVVDSVKDTVKNPLVKALMIVVVIAVILALAIAYSRAQIAKRRQQEEKNRRRSQDIRRRQEEENQKYSGSNGRRK